MSVKEILEAKSVKTQGQSKGCNANCCAGVVDSDLTFTTSEGCVSEIFQIHTSKVGSRTRITTRRISRSNHSSITDSKTANFSGVNRTRVVTTRSWSAPSVDIFSANDYRHGVFSFDAFNAMPANLNGLQRVSDDNSLISVGNFGSQEEQISAVTKEDSPCCSNQDCLCAVMGEGKREFTSNNEENYDGRDIDSSRTVINRVIHSTILSQSLRQKGLNR